MPRHIFKGRLCGYLCAECREPLSHVRVRLYRVRQGVDVAARVAASAKDSFAVLDAEALQGRDDLLIAEADTDADGSFTIALDETQYDGGPFDVDVRLETVPGLKKPEVEPFQLTVNTLQPAWTAAGDVLQFIWEDCLPYRRWCAIRARFGAWVICGHLTDCRTRRPIAGATVRAFDADWTQDDALGSGVTDATGHFQIHYTTASFRRTPWSPLFNLEWFGGPDVYFRADLGPDVVLAEPRSAGRTPGRENVGHCLCVDLCGHAPDRLIGEIDTPAQNACVQSQQVMTCLTSGAPLNSIAITGTAAGGPFDHYTLRYSYGGPLVNVAVVYPDCSRPPGSPSSSTAVTSGVLGWLDVNLLPPGVTEFTVRLDVFDGASGSVTASRTFTLKTKAIEITAVAAINVVEGEDPFHPGGAHVKLLKDVDDDDVAVPEVSIGGAFSITGSAYVVGCDRILREFGLSRFDAPPASPAPTPADASGGTVLFTPPVQPVIYDDTTAHPWQSGCFFPTPNTVLNGVLTSQWSTHTCALPFPPFTEFTVPKVVPIPTWPSWSLNGRFVMLLEVKDGPVSGPPAPAVAGVDRVIVWIDNQPTQANLSSIGGLAACIDLRLSLFVGTFAEIRGIAWDPPIDPTAPQQRPNDNFGTYSLGFQKNGGAGGSIPVEAHLAPIPATFGADVRVPNEWPVIVSPDGKLTDWDIVNALDAGSATPTPGIPAAAKLPRGQRCAYVITLGVSDSTRVGDSGGGHTATAHYALNIINDIA